jgi:hypothetical protein
LANTSKSGDAKKFRGAKKRLGITSRRDGFGRGGGWLWELPIQNSAATSVNYAMSSFYCRRPTDQPGRSA